MLCDLEESNTLGVAQWQDSETQIHGLCDLSTPKSTSTSPDSRLQIYPNTFRKAKLLREVLFGISKFDDLGRGHQACPAYYWCCRLAW